VHLLVCSGQDAVDADGNPQHPGDMAVQFELALDNLEAVLAAADMTLANIVRLNVYTTDIDELLKHFASLTDRFGNSDGRFATTLLQGSRGERFPPLTERPVRPRSDGVDERASRRGRVDPCLRPGRGVTS
jgi:hypothetical protein